MVPIKAVVVDHGAQQGSEASLLEMGRVEIQNSLAGNGSDGSMDAVVLVAREAPLTSMISKKRVRRDELEAPRGGWGKRRCAKESPN